MIPLFHKQCVPCEGDVKPLGKEAIHEYIKQLHTKWLVFNMIKLRKEFRFKDFRAAMLFVNRVASVAETEGHHPDISIFYDKVIIELWTHAIGGLSDNDFILAAKIEQIENID